MSSETRRELLEVLAELSQFCPEVRLGQLVTNLSYLASGPSNSAAWDVEDDELLKAAQAHLNEWRSRRGAAAKAG
jgi:hypothetical protein